MVTYFFSAMGNFTFKAPQKLLTDNAAEFISITAKKLRPFYRAHEGAFSYTLLTSVDLSSATEIGDYAFVYSDKLASVVLSKDGCTVGEGAFNPPPKVKSAVIRLVRNKRTDLGCDEGLFKTVVKTGFNQRRKTLRNSLIFWQNIM